MAAYSFIDNINDFFSTGYFTEDFQKKVFDKSGYSQEGIKELCSRFSALRQQYNRYKQAVTSRYAREKDKAHETFDFNSKLLECLGYYKDSSNEQPATVLSLPIGDNGAQQEVPVRIVCSRTDGTPQLYVMDIPTLISTSEDSNAETGFAELGLDKLVTHIFSLPEQEHPRYILMSSGNMVFFMDADKWERGAYLRFDIERLLVETTQTAMRNYFALFYLLVSREALAATSDTPLMQQLEEESYKNAYTVTQDLKKGVVAAVEALANEAIWYIKHTPDNQFFAQDETDDNFETMMRDDCLVFIYRLLFIFYAESRPDLDILPINDQTYQRGYSLEMLRDLEQVNLITDEERNGYFFDNSMKRLFSLILGGYNEDRVDQTSMTVSFRVRHIDSPLFSDKKLKVLQGVKFRNFVWQSIICQLSLSQQQKGKMRGRISYANLGINQLGSVYENLLAYRGFYAEEDYIEVHPVGDTVETYLQPRSRRDVFTEDEILKDEEGHDIIHPKGKFIYRLNGRDRKKSASFYTPEVLTKSTVKYTLKPIVEKLERGEIKACDLLQMKLLEPAMGAAAFQNEVINQLAVLYLNYRKKEVGKSIDPLQYPTELQHVKAFIATNNVYGVDLNSTAIELGKLSLWLNVMYKDMEVPFFSNRIGVGNAVIGAWLKVYKQSDVVRTGISKTRVVDKKWWEAPTRRISFTKSSTDRHYTEVYHFLLPVQEMLGITNAKLPTFGKDEEQKLKDNKKLMATIKKGWLKGICSEEYKQLQRISKKIDVLLKKYVEFQMSIAAYANNGIDVWQYSENREFPFNTNAQREELNDQRYRKDSAYMKLKMVMDYWCALFFWEYKDLADLPTRQEYWDDIERIINVDVSKEAKVRFSNVDKTGQEDLFAPKQGSIVFDEAEEDSAIKAQALTDILSEMGSKQTQMLALDGDAGISYRRFDIAEELADRYHFFHPMLEFLEVFWLRDGFDIICGNPPWVMPTFDVVNVIGEKFSEVILRGEKAPAIRKDIKKYFCEYPALEELYNTELVETTCTNVFTNSKSVYPYINGVQTDLYMPILESCFDMVNKNGYIGMVHPESLYEGNDLSAFRNEAYHRLCYHFQYENELNLFTGTNDHGRMRFGEHIYGKYKDAVSFISISNLFQPDTIDGCYTHNGHGICHGIKHDGKWNTAPHKDRMVSIDERALAAIAKVFENDEKEKAPKLIAFQTESSMKKKKKLAEMEHHVIDYGPIITTELHESGQVDDGTLERVVSQPKAEDDIVLNGPHVFLSNPMYKMPRAEVSSNSAYDIIDFSQIDEDFVPATCFRPLVSHEQLKDFIKGFQIGTDNDDKPIYDCWSDYYKLGISEWVGSAAERTLTGGIIPPNVHHVGTIVSVTFKNKFHLLELCGLINSLPLDFYIKITGASHIKQYRINVFPMGIVEGYKNALYPRVLMLNCLTKPYTNLWDSCWKEQYKQEKWSIDDNRLRPFSQLTSTWSWNSPARSYFERRMLILENDVISAMALGLSLNDIIMMYEIQFPVFKQYEEDTWYDQKGNIVFTASKGLKGVGVNSSEWELIRGEQLNTNSYVGANPTYVHTIDPKKSELYGGEQVTYYAPYTRCDRIADYRRAWAHFEKRFKNED